MSAIAASDATSDLSAKEHCNPRREHKQQPFAEHLGELRPTSCEYTGPDEVLVSLTTKTGEVISYSLKAAMLVHMVNLSVTLINGYTAQVFRDLDVF